MAGIVQFRVVVAVGILYVQGGLVDIAAAGGRICGPAEAVVVFRVHALLQELLRTGQSAAVMHGFQMAVGMHQQHQRRVLRLNGNHPPLHLRDGNGLMGILFGFLLGSGRHQHQRQGHKEEETFHTMWFDTTNVGKKPQSHKKNR